MDLWAVLKPIFTRSFDLLDWLMKAVNHFPRSQRFMVTKRLLDAGFDLRERLEEANLRMGPACMERLKLADDPDARRSVSGLIPSKPGEPGCSEPPSGGFA